MLSVAIDDGTIPVKNHVLVRIISSKGPRPVNNFAPPLNAIPKLPNFTSLPMPQLPSHLYPFTSLSTSTSTESSSSSSEEDTPSHRQNKTYIEGTTPSPPTTPSSTTETIKIIQDPPNTIVPILIAVLTIFLIAALIAVIIFRKQLMRPFSRKFKKSKVDKAKKSNQSIQIITLSDESSRNSMVMQHWQGPLAFNNRYTPWSHDDIHGQISNSSFSNDIKVPGYDRWEFPRHRLKVFNILGEGAFGQVWRCEANDIDGVEGISTVAVKTLKENATEVEKKDLMSELQVMKTLEPHVNVVRLLGCCTEKDPVFVIIEYVALGKLQSFLRNSRIEKNYHSSSGKSKTLTSRDLVSFMYQVARGMEFLSTRGVS